jgi:hypothetical protein
MAGTAISLVFAIRAEHRREDADNAKAEAIAAREDVEVALAQSLVRPLSLGSGDDESFLTDVETDSLWDLAQSPSDRLWLRFLEEATRTPGSTSQLRYRTETALIAALGLDLDKRERAQKLLAAQLQASRQIDRQQADIAIISMSLWDKEAFHPQLVADVLIRRLEILKSALGVNKGQYEDYWRREEIVDNSGHLLRCAEFLEHPKATPALEKVTQVVLKVIEEETNPNKHCRMAKQLTAAASRMEGPAGTRALRLAAQMYMRWLEEMEGHNEDLHADSLAALTGGLEAGEAVGMLSHALEKVRFESDRSRLIQALAAAATRLEPSEGGRLLESLLKEPTHSSDWREVAKSLASLAPRLEPLQAESLYGKFTRVLTEAIEREGDSRDRWQLTEVLASVAASLNPPEEKRVLNRAVEILTHWLEERLAIGPGIENPAPLAECRLGGLAAVAAHLEPTEAARLFREAARLLTEQLANLKEGNDYLHVSLADRLTAVAVYLEPGEAARALIAALKALARFEGVPRLPFGLGAATGDLELEVAARVFGLAAQVLKRRLENQTDSGAKKRLPAVASRLDAANAVSVLRDASQTLLLVFDSPQIPVKGETIDGGELLQVAHALVALANHLEPAEGARLLLEALDRDRWVEARGPLMNGLVAVTARLETGESSRCLLDAIRRLKKRIAERPLEEEVVWDAVASIASGLPPNLAIPLVKERAFLLCSNRGVRGEHRIGEEPNLDALLTNAGRPELNVRATAASAAIGLCSINRLGAAQALETAGKPLPCHLSTQDLVELLKMPTCRGKDRQIVLRHLGNRYGRTFANHWEFVRFAKEQQLDLEFTTPPKRPIHAVEGSKAD